MRTFQVARGLNLPLDAVTQKIAWLGRTGSGKTFGCKRFVEQMLHANAQVIVLDGSGAWAGLRLGKKAFKIPVFGGLFGDIPLEPTGGALVADVIIDRRTSMVIDVSQMLDAERTRFATAFARQFFFRKKSSQSAVHLVLEECQDFVPENQQRGEEQMLHEFQRLAKQGRPHGIGISFISQRPQEISKKALNQAECVFAFQMNGPQERKALQYWLNDKGAEERLADILPRLEIGAPHVWSPQWLKISKVVHILPIESLDTSRTPKVGEKKFKQKKLKPIDLKVLEKAMAETIERSKADDPKELKRRVVELEKALAKKVPAVAAAVVAAKPVPVNWKRMRSRLNAELKRGFDQLYMWGQNVIVDEEVLHDQDVRANAESKTPPPMKVTGGIVHVDREQESGRHFRREPKANGASNGAASIGGGLRRMMIALARRPGLTNKQIGVRAGLSSRSGTFSTYLSRGRTEGWIAYDGDRRALTDAGSFALGSYDPLPEGRELLEYWLRELGGGANRMLSAIAEAYPKALTNEELGAAADISHKSGTFSTYLSRLRTLELVTGRGEIQLSEELV